MYAFSLLVNATTLQNFTDRLAMCYMVFGSKYVNKKVEAACNTMEQLFKELNEETENTDDKEEDELEDEEYTEEFTLGNPFRVLILETVSTLERCDDSNYPKNQLYNNTWIKIFESKWIDSIPFWSSILRGMVCAFRHI